MSTTIEWALGLGWSCILDIPFTLTARERWIASFVGGAETDLFPHHSQIRIVDVENFGIVANGPRSPQDGFG
jgi:hypothetical protein